MTIFTFIRRVATAVLLLLCISTLVQADPITREQAQQRAEAFLQKMGGSKRLSPVRSSAKLAPRHKAATAENELYYVFNRGSQEGYVIASGDDKTLPVLGYTDEGEFDYKQLPDNMRSWLANYESQLAEIRKSPLQQAPRYAPLHAAIEPMVTSRWSQGTPYNNECPMYFNLGRSVTGCVATAMAQLLYYWRDISVTETQAEMPAYDTHSEHESFGHLHVDGIAKESPIDWANMRDNYNSGYTGVQATAVAQLMHYCGVAVEMDYTNSASGAYSYMVAEALPKYFGYGNSVSLVYGNSYSADGWDALLYNELAEGRPFYLSGSNATGGHAFVCDGYDGNHCFHINWGWGGTSDGYFLLTSLNPSSQGIGGSGDGYSGYPEAVIGIQPPANGTRAMAFSNAATKKIATTAFDADGDGVLTYAEAAAVSDLGLSFKGQRFSSFEELRYFTGLTSLPDSAFAGCATLSAVTLPKQLTSISHAAFAGCKVLKTFTFGANIKSIDDAAFSGCIKLADITLPASVKSIGARAFEDCTALTTLELPIALTSIGDEAFKGCTKLKAVSTESMMPSNIKVGTNVFAGIDLSTAELTCQQGTEQFFGSVEPWNQFDKVNQLRNLVQGQFGTLEVNTPYYIYNVGTGRFLTKGEAWGTQAVVAMANDPMRFELRHPSSLPAGVYYLYSNDTGTSGFYTFRTNDDPKLGIGVKGCFVDGTLDKNAAASRWSIVALDNGAYTIQTPSNATGYVKGEFLGVDPSHASNEASPTYGAYSDVSYDLMPTNCQWLLVPYDADRKATYEAAMQLANLIEVASMRHINVTYEQSVYDDMTADTETLLRTVRTLRKRMNLINFDNDAVRKACVSAYDANGDGELSYSEAKSVEYLSNDDGFMKNTDVTTFDELKYFTGLAYIYYNTFAGCSKLERIALPESVIAIHWQAFIDCKALKTVELGRSVKLIDEGAFKNCTGLREMHIQVENPSDIPVQENTFEGVNLSLATLYVPYGSRELYANAPIWKKFGKIVETHHVPYPEASELILDEPVYVRNVLTRMFINKGEAYGTQAIVDNSGLIYKLKRTASMKAGLYYLEATNSGTSNKVLFRTSSDSKVGNGVKACFVDGTATAKSYWMVHEIDAEKHIYALQVPVSDAEYNATQCLGYDLEHESNASPYGTYGLYYDVTYDDNPAACQWQFIRLSDIEEMERQDANLQNLRELLSRATNKQIDVTEEQAVYDNIQATDSEVVAAIESLRRKLNYIEFTDQRAKTVCVNYWDLDDDGELSTDEAAMVTRLGTAFNSATGMSSLCDLRYFTGLTAIPDNAFHGCVALQAICVPEGVTTIGQNAFTGLSTLKHIALLNSSQPVQIQNATTSSQTIFVPEALVNSYAAMLEWNASRITTYTGIPVVTPDNASRNYGRSNPTFTYHVDGAPIAGIPSMEAPTAEATSPVGEYEICIGPGTITIDNVIYKSGVLTINPSPITVSVGNYTRNIGEDNPEFEVTYRTFRNREKSDVLLVQPTVECDATKESPAGEYEIRVFGAEAQNYTFTYENGTLTVVNPDGVRDIRTDASATTGYDLTGRAMQNVTKRTKPGIYIVGGKKVVVK